MVDREGGEHFVLKLQTIKKAIIHKGLRPTIPTSTPPALATLIKDCWVTSPDARPPFLQIRQRLKTIVANSGVSLFSLSHRKCIDENDVLGSTKLNSSMDMASSHEQLIESVAVHNNKQPVFCMLFVPKHEQLWCGCRDGTISVWDVNTWKLVAQMPLHQKRIYDMIMVNDHIWTASDDGQIIVLDPAQVGRRAEVHKFTVGTGRMVKSLCWVIPDYVGGIQDTVWCCCPADSSVYIFNTEVRCVCVCVCVCVFVCFVCMCMFALRLLCFHVHCFSPLFLFFFALFLPVCLQTYSLVSSFPLEPTPMCLLQVV
jgi:hypothetical protein